MKGNLELKVGIFVFAGLAALSFLVFRAGDFYLKPGYHIRLVFSSAAGLDKGAEVHVSGVNVGEVTDLQIVKNTEGVPQVEMSARIDEGVFIEEDARPGIATLGVFGEKYVSINPGTSGAKGLTEGGTLAGEEGAAGESLHESGTRLIGKIEKAVESIDKVVSDPEFQSSIKGTFNKSEKTFGHAEIVARNLIETTDDLKDAARSAKIVLGRLRDGEGSVGRLLKDDTVAKDLEAFVKDIKANPWKLLKRG
jgi:phospholipid/cholesterol/gamma-HCH transport system substrate-binding protein